jgi:thioredoxin-like negative regulator of GroEL
MMIFQDGQASTTKVGAMPKSQIKEWIDESL